MDLDNEEVVPEFDTEWTDDPTCPYCGYKIKCVSDYDGGFYSEDEFEFECPSCCKPVRSQAYISFSYTTSKIDREAEAKLDSERKEKESLRTAQRLAECQKWLPGTKIRVREESGFADCLRGRTGVVANREINKYNPFVEVDLDPREGHSFHRNFFDPSDLERM